MQDARHQKPGHARPRKGGWHDLVHAARHVAGGRGGARRHDDAGERRPAGRDPGRGRGARPTADRAGRLLARAAARQVRRRATRRSTSRMPRSSPQRPASTSGRLRRLGGSAAARPRSAPTSAAGRTSSSAGPTIRTSMSTSCVDAHRHRQLSRQEIWRLVAAGREVRHEPAPAAGSRCRWAPPAAGWSTASPGSRRRASTSVPTDARQVPRAVPQAQGERPSGRASRSATPSATATPGATG